MKRGVIITLAWPEGMTTAAGAWYDKFFSKKGKYRVGHSALVMINFEKETSHYFDFGRYHTAKGYGRVRDSETDPALAIQPPVIKDNNILNIEGCSLYIFLIILSICSFIYEFFFPE